MLEYALEYALALVAHTVAVAKRKILETIKR